MIFEDRIEAGKRLAQVLMDLHLDRPLVLAVPRGGVPVAAEVCLALKGRLDLVMVRKIGAPGNPELALGAVAPGRRVYLNQELCRSLDLSRSALQPAIEAASRELARRLAAYPGYGSPRVKGQTVVMVDDGIATGFTVEAGLHHLRQDAPAQLILAVPVGSSDSLARLEPLVDRLVCIHTPDDFYAVGQFYRHFDQVDDSEVLAALARCRRHHPARRESE